MKDLKSVRVSTNINRHPWGLMYTKTQEESFADVRKLKIVKV